MLNIYLDVSTRLPSHRTPPCCETAPGPTFCRPPNITAGTFFWLALPPCRHTAIPSPIHPWFPVAYKYSLTWTCWHLQGNRNSSSLSCRAQGEQPREVAIDFSAASFVHELRWNKEMMRPQAADRSEIGVWINNFIIITLLYSVVIDLNPGLNDVWFYVRTWWN